MIPKKDEPTAIRVCGLIKRYPSGTEANRGIDVAVNRGELVSILGPNGAGKTTFLRQITTELRPTSGSVEIFGVDAVAQPMQAKRAMGITPQEAGIFETLKALPDRTEPVPAEVRAGTHLTLALRHPQHFARVVGFSGRYDLTLHVGDFHSLFHGFYDNSLCAIMPSHFVPYL